MWTTDSRESTRVSINRVPPASLPVRASTYLPDRPSLTSLIGPGATTLERADRVAGHTTFAPRRRRATGGNGDQSAHIPIIVTGPRPAASAANVAAATATATAECPDTGIDRATRTAAFVQSHDNDNLAHPLNHGPASDRPPPPRLAANRSRSLHQSRLFEHFYAEAQAIVGQDEDELDHEDEDEDERRLLMQLDDSYDRERQAYVSMDEFEQQPWRHLNDSASSSSTALGTGSASQSRDARGDNARYRLLRQSLLERFPGIDEGSLEAALLPYAIASRRASEDDGRLYLSAAEFLTSDRGPSGDLIDML